MEVIFAGHIREITYDEFGLMYTDGMLLDEFLKHCSPEERALFIKEGERIEAEEPALFEDLMERLEI